jgi:tetrahydromethanopterin S-methyltransferase subunit F
MKNPLDTIRGTIIVGFVFLAILLVIILLATKL